MEPPVASRVTAYAGCGLSLLTLRCQRRDNHPLCLHGADLRVCHRACGGNDVLHVFKGAEAGLSPRVRGNPSVTYRRRQTNEAYPRAYGEPYPRAANLYGVRRL